VALGNSTTLGDAKAWLRARLDQGEACPLCTQHAKMYKRKINSGMARSLIHMYRSAGKQWIHVSLIGARSREEGKLVYWGLVEEQQGNGLHGGRGGYWRVTDKGEMFLKGKLNVPKYAKVYNGRVFGLEGDTVNIRDALGTKFNYDDLMRGV
jgi:hypothetical protein